MDFQFSAIDPESGNAYERASVHVSIDPEFPVLKFEVDLDSLPSV